MSRLEFENTEWTRNATDLMLMNPAADRDCESCDGYGVVDEGGMFGCILKNCPDCYNKKFNINEI